MDIKLGTRTLLQSESENETSRSDLFKKLLASRPSALTSAERAAQAVTKRRYMEARDANSTSGSLGFLVDGTSSHEGRKASTEQQPIETFRTFAKSATASDEGPPSPGGGPGSVAWKVAEQLLKLREAMEASTFVQNHELVGTSVLLVVDAACGTCSASWIDFAKARPYTSEQGLSHRAPATHGGHEGGLLTGLDNLISTWIDLARTFGMAAGSLDTCLHPPRRCTRVRRMTSEAQALMTRLRLGNVRKCPRIRLTAPYTKGLEFVSQPRTAPSCNTHCRMSSLEVATSAMLAAHSSPLVAHLPRTNVLDLP